MKERASKRAQVFISAEIILEGQVHKILVRDVSDKGARISAKGEKYAKVGQKGIFRKDDVETPCHVAWVNDTGYGIAFDRITQVQPSKPKTTFEPDAPYSRRHMPSDTRRNLRTTTIGKGH